MYLTISLYDNIMTEYRDIIQEICSKIHTGIIDFNEPRSKASMPTQASSEFITNKQQGDWAEDVIFRAINNNSDNIVAVRYGKSDDLVAGDIGFKEFFNKYQEELDSICYYSGKKILTRVLGMTSAYHHPMKLKATSAKPSPALRFVPAHS